MSVVVGILNKNCGTELRSCLNSLIIQSFNDFSVVVVDGGSTDDSLKILKEYVMKDKRIIYFIQKSKGTGMARNEILEYVNENFSNVKKLIWGDAENMYDKDYLQTITNIEGDVIGGKNIINSSNPLSQSLWWYYNGFGGKSTSGNNECVDMKIYKKYKYAPVIRGEDSIFHKIIKKDGFRFKQAPEAFCYITTVTSFREFMNWTKTKAVGSFQGLTHFGSWPRLIGRYLFFSVLSWIYLFAGIIFLLSYPSIFFYYLFISLFVSLFFYLKGRRYVVKPRLITIFWYCPILFLHFSIMLTTLLKETFKERSLI